MKKSSYNIFSLRLWLDAMKRTAAAGIIFTVIMLIISIFVPVKRYYSVIGGSDYRIWEFTPVLHAFVYMALLFVVVAPVLVFMTFSFLNKRSTSDYYHSFPHKRICIFNSLLAAVMAWITAITVICYISSLIMYNILGNTLRMDYGEYTLFMLCMYASALLVSAACMLACSVTGTLFSNIIVTGLILFLPRILISTLVGIIRYSSILLRNETFLLADGKYNLVFSSVYNFFNNRDYGEYIGAVNAVYTIILAIIYIVLAAVLFIRRKSETAGMASVNKGLQCIIRLAVAMPACLAAIWYEFGIVIGKYDSLSGTDVINIVIFYIIAFALMFIYELVSTRRLKNIMRVVPSVFILVFLNIVLTAGLVVTYNAEVHYLPSADSVEYITSDSFISGAEMNMGYFRNKLSNYRITDKEIISIVLQALEETVDIEKERIRDAENEALDADEYEEIINNGMTCFHIKSGLFERTRNIYMSKAFSRSLYDMVSNNDEIKKIYQELPEYDPSHMAISEGYNDSIMSEEQYIDVYKSLVAEVKNISLDDWSEALEMDSIPYMSISIHLSSYDGDDMLILPVTPATPKTLELAVNYCNENVSKDKLEEVRNIIDKRTKEDAGYSDAGESDTIDEGPYYLISIECYNYNSRQFELVASYEPETFSVVKAVDMEELINRAVEGCGSKISLKDAEESRLYRIDYSIEKENDDGLVTDSDRGEYYFVSRH